MSENTAYFSKDGKTLVSLSEMKDELENWREKEHQRQQAEEVER